MTANQPGADGCAGDEPTIRLEAWRGPWPDDDPNANLKHDVALYALVDPLETVRALAEGTGIPVGALVRYVLARWASAGSEGILAAGPSIVERMWEACEAADAAATDAARVEAYEVLRSMVSWLRLPLD